MSNSYKYNKKKIIVPIINTLKTTALLNMRTGGNYTDPIILVIPKGQEVTLIDKLNDNWYHVKYNDKQGYCASQFLQ